MWGHKISNKGHLTQRIRTYAYLDVHTSSFTQVSEFAVKQLRVRGLRLRQSLVYTKEDIEQSATTRRLWDLARNKAAFMIQKFMTRTLVRSSAKRYNVFVCVCVCVCVYVCICV